MNDNIGRTIYLAHGGGRRFQVASPEYNMSMPALVKNAIDWLSRTKPMPLRGKNALLLSASQGLVGGNRGLWALRVPLEVLGVHVYPDMFSLATAQNAFSEGGGINSAGLTMNGLGTLNLDGANTYTGPTAVNAGVFASILQP